MSTKVFSYGSNMCSGRFRAYDVKPQGPGRASVLKDYRLFFNKKSEKDGSGKANVEPHVGGEVWGVLYEIRDADVETLDRGEGKGYIRRSLTVGTNDGSAVESWVYVARNPGQDPALRPYTWYKRFLVEGAREHGLPAHYIEALEAIEATDDPDHHRDREKRTLVCGKG